MTIKIEIDADAASVIFELLAESEGKLIDALEEAKRMNRMTRALIVKGRYARVANAREDFQRAVQEASK